ncbi:MAG: T9SS type A sorting domain-containing protein [Saprospiraceae bacterium]
MMKCYMLPIIFISFSLSHVYSQAGKLDSTFGDQGIVIKGFGGRSNLLETMIIQQDQKIVAAGSSFLPNGWQPIMVASRYMPDGSIDVEFGIEGYVSFALDNAEQCHAITIQPDGRILLAGQTTYHSNITHEVEDDFVIVRLTQDGSLDHTFGNGGYLITHLGQEYEWANEIIIQEDEKIIVVGISSNLGSAQFAMIRYESNGDIDLSFGNEGIVRTSILHWNEATAVVILPDGKIILGGTVNTGAFPRRTYFAMVRYHQNGTIDSLFGHDGFVQTDLAGSQGDDYVFSMLLEPDGKIVLGGYANFIFQDYADIGVVRYNADGTLDTSFGNGGMFIHTIGPRTLIHSIARESNGKYLLAGISNVIDSVNNFFLARLEHNGSLDTTFGQQGIVLTDILGNYEFLSTLLIQKDSKILVGGSVSGINKRDFVLARYFSDFIFTPFAEGLCPGDSTGTAGLEISGGQPPYLFSIDGQNYQPDPVFEGLVEGNYFITVTDSQDPPVTAVIGPIVLSFALPTGTVEVIEDSIIISSDGQGFQLYSIDGLTFQADSIFTNVPDGVYLITVVTTNGCVIPLDSVTVVQTGIQVISPLTISISPNPCKEIISIEVEGQSGSFNCILSDLTGRVIRIETLYKGSDGKLWMDTRMLNAGLYLLGISNNSKSGVVSFVVQK